MMYAQGTVSGNVYTVAWGDTWYSIGVRFGLPYQDIQAANGYPPDAPLYAGTQLIIPGLCAPTYPPATPIPAPTAVPPTSSTCSITVYPSKTVYAQPDYNSTLIGVTQPNSTYPVIGAWVQGSSGSRWYPIGGFEAPGYVNVYPGEYMLTSNCPG
jgi:LysM repeat protein